MNYLKNGFIILGALFLSSCASYIHTETRPIDAPGDISEGIYYQWTDSALSLMAPTEQVSSSFSDAIRAEVNQSLNDRGYQEATETEPDFYIDAVLTLSREEAQRVEANALSDQEEFLQYGLKWKLSPNQRILKPAPNYPTQELTYYQNGTLHIGAFDSAGLIAWHGEAHKIIEMTHTPNEHRAVLREAARRLMLKFPKATESKK